MEVILLEKIDRLGELGDRVQVRPGYARNYLIPQRKATEATPANVAKFEAQRAEYEAKLAEKISKAQSRAAALQDQVITITAHAGDEGRLFGSVGPHDIVAAAEKMGLELQRHEIRMPTGPIRQLGEYELDVHLFTDVNSRIIVRISAE